MLLLGSCQTVKTEKEYVYICPQVEWPEFPNVEECVYNDEDDTITVSGDWWAELAIYKRDIDKIKAIYKKMGDE